MQKKKHIIGIMLVMALCIQVSKAGASTLIGFTTSATGTDSSFNITSNGNNMSVLDFGSLNITEAKEDAISISELIGGEVLISDVIIDVSSEMLEATYGAMDVYSYAISSGTILDGFAINVNNSTVLNADLSLNLIYTYGKAGLIDTGLTLDLTNIEVFTTGLDAATVSFLNDFLPGGDILLTLASSNNTLAYAIRNGISETGVVGGTIVPNGNAVPEPISYFIMGWGALVLYSLRKMGFFI